MGDEGMDQDLDQDQDDEEIEEEEKPTQCYFCHFDTEELHRSPRPVASRVDAKEVWFCEVCYSTMGGVAFWYPEQFAEKLILRTISYTTNMILSHKPITPEEIKQAHLEGMEFMFQHLVKNFQSKLIAAQTLYQSANDEKTIKDTKYWIDFYLQLIQIMDFMDKPEYPYPGEG